MIVEIGHFSIISALSITVLLSIIPLIGASRNNVILMYSAKPLSFAVFFLLLIAFLILLWAFYTNDFTLIYVAMNSNTQLPWYYRLSALWGAHEGSLLLWVLIQSGWTAAVSLYNRSIPQELISRVLAVMGMINFGFLLFIVVTSNPFIRTLPFFPIDGNDLNPLLQDFGLIVHPPMLYMGYVGFSVAFSFAIASLMTGNLDMVWIRFCRPWTITAWLCLTLGIALGSWWAYYELGWGGWWFWDPVENSSLMPWLSGTALMHSLAVSEKRGTFKKWTILLAIFTFSLSLLGTFLVRSGILMSVHAFAADPSRGIFMLSFLIFVIGGSLLLFAMRVKRIRSTGTFALVSRENALLGNNIFLITALLVVLVGTLLPLVHKQIGLGSLSVGTPFFNTIFFWLMLPFSFLLGIGPLIRWKRDQFQKFIKPMVISGLLSLGLSAVVVFVLDNNFNGILFIGLVMACWIIILHCIGLYERSTYRNNFLKGFLKLRASYWAMFFAHIGLSLSIIGIAVVQNCSIEHDIRLAPGEYFQIQDYHLYFKGLRNTNGPNYSSYIADFEIIKNGQYLTLLQAEKRIYFSSSLMMTEVGIDWGLTRDLYIAMGEPLEDNNSWSIHVAYKPFIRWIWIGLLFMAFGGLIAISDNRYSFHKFNLGR
ncbi:heme lyase CcmF/NrfE family subunit [Candidatus Photodesmus anomalopis]|uniref:Cytochrome c-type biogenesis protein CcmF n=1 Tax=Candidatus Photodesmus katoptron Akat1 TaxID=1236703 RepID=S3EHN1_9GAMM|nr:heme lyase CcmF/NrfE family subunit [Candidatus Photodesmus katoptron]EPE37693.1 cytochrome c-type biogenesis protein CcmF [Candidatus Photodesmus katoptron Akat1]